MAHFLTLNVGAAKATLAEYALSGKRGLTLVAYGSADLIGASAESADSMIASLTPALRQIMHDKGIRPAPLLLSLGGQTVFPRFTKFPAVPADKLEQLVRYEVEQDVPFPIDEIVSDHQILGMTPEGEQNALIVAAKLDQVRAVTDAVRAAGLRPVAVDAAPMAIYNALNWAYPGLSGCTIVLDIGSRTTNLILVENGRIYNRAIPVAGNAITKEIALSFGCTPIEAEQLKLERGYVSLGGVTEDEDEVSDRVSKVIRTVLTRLHAEISRSINFYRSQQGGGAPARLVLTGGGARLPQLDRFFRETLQVEVDYLNPFGSAQFGSKVSMDALENDAFSLAETVGLAVRRTDLPALRINLLPPEIVQEERALKRIPALMAAGGCVLAALGLGIFAQNHAAEVAQAQKEKVEGRNIALRGLETKLKAEQAAARTELEKCDEVSSLLASRANALVHVQAVRASLIQGMWIVEWTPEKTKADPSQSSGGRSSSAADAPPPTVVRVTIRGWNDEMKKAEAAWSEANGGKKATSAEIVQAALKSRPVVVADSVKIVAQREVKDCLVEFAIRLEFAPPPSVLAEQKGAGKGKGARR